MTSGARIIVLGTMAADPYAGMAWMNMQITEGLRRLGHDAYYFETTSNWPYDPVRRSKVCDSEYAVAYLAGVAEQFGLRDRWAYRRSYLDNAWLGMDETRAVDLLATADAVLNVSGATKLREENLEVRRNVLFSTDPVYFELGFARGDSSFTSDVEEFDDVISYGENIGQPDCPIPPLPRLRGTTRQAILVDRWSAMEPTAPNFTTVSNWRQLGRDIEFEGELYSWSKHHEFLRFLAVPELSGQPVELAVNLEDRAKVRPRQGGAVDEVFAPGVTFEEGALLEEHGWLLTDSQALTRDPWTYHDYVCRSPGEFSVAKDQNIRLRSGWFSERSACYLAAGRPVITQDTGFGRTLPTGEGLFAFGTIGEAVAALDAVRGDYARHSRAAREIAVEYFRAEQVLAGVVQDLGLS